MEKLKPQYFINLLTAAPSCPPAASLLYPFLLLGNRTMQASVRRLALYPLGVARSGQIRGALLGPVPRLLCPSTRTLFSETGVWEKDYRTETRRRVEEWWHPRIMAQWQKDALEVVRRPFDINWQSISVSVFTCTLVSPS